MMRWSPAAPARPGCPHNRLSRLLAAELPNGITVGASTLRPWASANFVGARHLFPCIGPVPARALQERLAALEWRLPGHIVADLSVEPGNDDGHFRIEILTVED
ncbi:hypothetical protein [Sphingopyxis sp.]|uniref:hypothetical protein n=1 Tax=Sphingopyxis sp. TaxID=1908224 RepID=UPI003BAB4C7F